MIAILLLEDNGGMMFNHRRQSRDRVVTERIAEICSGKKLWMNGYSFKFYGVLDGVETLEDEAFLSKAGEGDFCLVEDASLKPYIDQLEGLVIFRWNRAYPSDVYTDIRLEEWEMTEMREYPGNSHEKITEEFYRRKQEHTL